MTRSLKGVTGSEALLWNASPTQTRSNRPNRRPNFSRTQQPLSKRWKTAAYDTILGVVCAWQCCHDILDSFYPERHKSVSDERIARETKWPFASPWPSSGSSNPTLPCTRLYKLSTARPIGCDPWNPLCSGIQSMFDFTNNDNRWTDTNPGRNFARPQRADTRRSVSSLWVSTCPFLKFLTLTSHFLSILVLAGCLRSGKLLQA